MNYSTSSGRKTASAQIYTRPGALVGISLSNPDTGQSLLTIWDSSSSNTSGKDVIAEVEMDAGMNSVNHEFMAPVCVNYGLYAELTYTSGGSGSSYLVRFIGG